MEPTDKPSVYLRKSGQRWEIFMSDNSGGIGVMGVLIGALIVIVVGGGLLFATGMVGNSNTSTVKLEVPKVTAPK
jgi:hypothetical protein